jgi:hypothetical protein
MATIHIGQETESVNCWVYQVQVRTRRQQYAFAVTLNWSDYDHWSHGRVSPSVVVDAVMRFLLEKQPPEELAEKFDCAIVRRRYPELDELLPEMF